MGRSRGPSWDKWVRQWIVTHGLVAVGSLVLLFVVGSILVLLDPSIRFLTLVVVSGVGLILLIQIASAEHLRGRIENLEYGVRQLECLTSLTASIQPRAPLPPVIHNSWAITPELALVLVREILARRPGLVVECGSGASTLICGYALEKAWGGEGGRLISLEHDPRYWEETCRAIAVHDLARVVEVVSAPLVEWSIGGQTWRWYDLERVRNLDRPIDLLFVDGPPGHVQPRSRYPAVPLLREHLAPDAVIILDDVNRDDEQAVLAMWLRELPGAHCERLPLSRPAALLRLS